MGGGNCLSELFSWLGLARLADLPHGFVLYPPPSFSSSSFVALDAAPGVQVGRPTGRDLPPAGGQHPPAAVPPAAPLRPRWMRGAPPCAPALSRRLQVQSRVRNRGGWTAARQRMKPRGRLPVRGTLLYVFTIHLKDIYARGGRVTARFVALSSFKVHRTTWRQLGC